MLRIKTSTVLIVLILFLNCTSLRTIQVLESDYQTDSKNYNTSVTLLPFTEELVNQDVLGSYLSKEGNDPSMISTKNKDIFKNYFGLTFSETTTGEINDLVSSKNLDFLMDIEFVDSLLVLNKHNSSSFLIPKKGKLYDSSNRTDFTLLTQSIVWEVGYVEEQSRAVGGSPESRIDFLLRLKYVLWDNQNEKIAG